MAGLECGEGLLPREYSLGRFGKVEVCGERVNRRKLDTIDNRVIQGAENDLQLTDVNGDVVSGPEARERLGLAPVDMYSEEALKRYFNSIMGLNALLTQVDAQQLAKVAASGDAEEMQRWQGMGAYFLSPSFHDKWCSSTFGLEAGQTTEKMNLAHYGSCAFDDSRALLGKFFTSSQRTRLIQEILRPLQTTVVAVQQDSSSAALEFRTKNALFMNYVSLAEAPLDLLFADTKHLSRLVDAYSARFQEVNAKLDEVKQHAEALIASIRPDQEALQSVGACFGKSGEHEGVKVWEMSHQCYTKMNDVIAHGNFAEGRENAQRLAELAADLRAEYPSYATQLVEDLDLVSSGRRAEPTYADSIWYQAAQSLHSQAWVNQPLEMHCDEDDDECDDELPRLSWDPAKNKVRFESRHLVSAN